MPSVQSMKAHLPVVPQPPLVTSDAPMCLHRAPSTQASLKFPSSFWSHLSVAAFPLTEVQR